MNRSFILVVAVAAAAAQAEPLTYRIDPDKSEVVAITKPAGVGAGLSHHHVIEAKGLEGQIVHDPTAPEKSSVEVSVPTNKLVNDDPATVKRHGLEAKLSADDRKKVGETIQSAEQLDSSKFPKITFKSTAVRALPGGKLEIAGQLSIRGVSKEVKLPVTLSTSDGAVHGEGKLQITHAQFGFKPVSLLFGAIANAEEIEIRVKLVAVPKT